MPDPIIRIEFPRVVSFSGGGGGGGGVTDHGALTGLGDDDHSQYHNNARGDARYSLLAHTHTSLSALDVTTFRLAISGGRFVRLSVVEADGEITVSPVLESS